MSASRFFGERPTLQLLRQDGSLLSVADALRDKRYVLVYFSAHWCPPCRNFTPQLKEFYERNHVAKNFEIIFVSLDNGEPEMKSYFREAHGNWLCVPYADGRVLGQDWMARYGCRFIPTLLVFEQPDVGQPEKTLRDGAAEAEKVSRPLSTDPYARADGSSRVLVTRAGRDMVPRDPNATLFPWPNADAEVAHRNKRMMRIVIALLAAIAFFLMWTFMG